MNMAVLDWKGIQCVLLFCRQTYTYRLGVIGIVFISIVAFIGNWIYIDSNIITNVPKTVYPNIDTYNTNLDGSDEKEIQMTDESNLSFIHMEGNISEGVSGENPALASSGFKTILLWNRLHKKDDYGFGIGRSGFLRHRCPKSRCKITIDKNDVTDADAVVVHTRAWRNLGPDLFPRRQSMQQIIVFFNLEAPIRTSALHLRPHNDSFNLTMTYKLDSDIAVPLWYVENCSADEAYVPLTANQVQKKRTPVAWFISNCDKRGSIRWSYGVELSKHIHVDIYGKCGPLNCPRDQTRECMKMAERKYKFYLSFENSVCPDYVTEKLVHPMSHDIVPIVFGGFDYEKNLPPHSTIDVRKFKSPKHLAQYLIYLDENDEEYLKYFEWKREFKITGMKKDKGFCRLCEILHDPNYKYKSRFDAFDWWLGEGNSTKCVHKDTLLQEFGLE